MMYLRPGNMKKDFIVKEKDSDIVDGHVLSNYRDTSKLVRGIIADADTRVQDRKKHMWDQEQHTLTHTIVCDGSPKAKMGDLLAHDERAFFVLLAENPGELNISTIYYVEERNDVR